MMKKLCLGAVCALALASTGCIETAAAATAASASTYIGNKGQREANFPHSYRDTFAGVLNYLQGDAKHGGAEAQIASANPKQGYIRANLPEGQSLIFEIETLTANSTRVKLTAKNSYGIHSDDLAKEHFDAITALLK